MTWSERSAKVLLSGAETAWQSVTVSNLNEVFTSITLDWDKEYVFIDSGITSLSCGWNSWVKMWPAALFANGKISSILFLSVVNATETTRNILLYTLCNFNQVKIITNFKEKQIYFIILPLFTPKV